MNGIQATERLTFLNNVIPAIEKSIDETSWRSDYTSEYLLNTLLGELVAERDELNRKLSEVSI